jgi:hypothetical protein
MLNKEEEVREIRMTKKENEKRMRKQEGGEEEEEKRKRIQEGSRGAGEEVGRGVKK